MRWLIAAGIAAVGFSLAAFGTLVPLRDPAGIEYLYAWPGAPRLAVAALSLIAVVVLLHVAVVRMVRRAAPHHLDYATSGRWLAPIAALGVMPLGLLPAVPGIGEPAAPLAYVFYDLRWWWAAAALAVVAARVLHLAGRGVSLGPRSRDALVFVVCVLWATATTQHLRFQGDLHGDEPKYLRYCELWYQGGAFDITEKVPFADVPQMTPPRVWRMVPAFGRAVADEVPQLVRDVTAFVRSPRHFQWNRASGDEGNVVGKRGGVYQMYQPGVSGVLFPGYVIDRLLFGDTSGYQQEFPARLWFTNLTMLLLYGACGVALYRLLRQAVGSEALAFGAALVVMLALPASAFAFQLYPELVSLLILLTVTNVIFFHRTAPARRIVVCAGAAAAVLVWMHPRFLLVSLVLVVAGLIRMPRDRRWWFAGAALIVYASFGAFCYRVTGSFMPTALWDAAGPEAAISLRGLPLNLLGYAVDRTWGMLPHAPILVAAIPGLFLLARREPWQALFVVTIVLALCGPAAGHTLSAAGGTPGRLIIAVVPLLAWPIAVAAERWSRRAAFRVAAVVLAILSLETAASYNRHHVKAVGQLRTDDASGWRPNLLFPVVRGASGFTFASAWTRHDYLMAEETARATAAERLLTLGRCALCFTSRRDAVDWRSLEPNSASGVVLESSVAGTTATFQVWLLGEQGAPAFARMRLDYGDGSSSDWMPVIGHRQATHAYGAPGAYPVALLVELRDGSTRGDRQTVRVGGR